jgi:Gas vesicle synthesis protein GvpL/GvpF
VIAATATAWYVYGVVAADDEDAPRRAAECRAGVGGESGVELVGSGTLAAIVSRVPPDEFDEASLHVRLNDLPWLEAKARAHEDVLQTVGGAAVVPFRFGTIYHELADVEAMLDERRDALAASLERVRGRVEIGVKAWRMRAVESPAVDAPSGRAYLEARGRARRASEEIAARAADAMRRAHERLLDVAIDGVVNRPQPRELSGREEQMLLNAAYLVAAGDDRLLAEVARLSGELEPEGFVFEATGPWPPHNFVDEDGR